MTQEIEILNPNGDYITARIRGEFEVTIPRARDGFVIREAKVAIDPELLQEAADFASGKRLSSVSYYPKGIDQDGVTVYAERSYSYKGDLYRFRDTKKGSTRRVEVQYATKNETGYTVWKPCPEGGSFAEVEPFEAIAD